MLGATVAPYQYQRLAGCTLAFRRYTGDYSPSAHDACIGTRFAKEGSPCQCDSLTVVMEELRISGNIYTCDLP